MREQAEHRNRASQASRLVLFLVPASLSTRISDVNSRCGRGLEVPDVPEVASEDEGYFLAGWLGCVVSFRRCIPVVLDWSLTKSRRQEPAATAERANHPIVLASCSKEDKSVEPVPFCESPSARLEVIASAAES